MRNVNCPPREDLAAVVAGTLQGVVAERVRGHAAGCDQCGPELHRLQQLSGEYLARNGSAAPAGLFQRLVSVLHAEGRPTPDSAGPPEIPRRAAGSPARSGTIGSYLLLEELGSGGMGIVYRAMHTKLGRQVALKVLLPERLESPRAVLRFEREMKAVGRLDHPHIVRAFDAGEVNGTHFLAMELVDGIDAQQVVDRDGPLPVRDACEIIRQGAEGLAHAHAHALVHRDIKPSNLIISRSGVVKLLDLGVALLSTKENEPQLPTKPNNAASGSAHPELTSAGIVVGTFDYMPPEQIANEGVDARADIFGMGATLYKLLCGHPPRKTDDCTTPREKAELIRRAAIIPIDQRRPALPRALQAALGKMLAANPADRYQTSGEVVAALQPFCEGANLARLITDPAEARKGESTPAVVLAPMEKAANRLPVVMTNSPRAPGRSTLFSPKILAPILGGLVVIAVAFVVAARFLPPAATAARTPELQPQQNSQPAKSATPESEKPYSAVTVAPSSEKKPSSTVPAPSPVLVKSYPPLPEPKPLEKWLEGRKRITVSKVGVADHHSIRDALAAVKTGEVVEVLDQGPYLEPLDIQTPLPGDIGLISSRRAVIMVPEWIVWQRHAAREGWIFGGIALQCGGSFRMAGFDVTAPPHHGLQIADHAVLRLKTAGETIIESCRILRNPPVEAPPWQQTGLLPEQIRISTLGPTQLTIQDNHLEAGLLFDGEYQGTCLIQRNRILGRRGITTPPQIERLVVKDNVIHAGVGVQWYTQEAIGPSADRPPHEIVNNVCDCNEPAIMVRAVGVSQVFPPNLPPMARKLRIQNNTFRSGWGGGILIRPADWEQVRGGWTVSHNVYLDKPRDFKDVMAIPLGTGDQVVAAPYLSLRDSEPGYFRIAADGPLAQGGAGGDLPVYIGAAPPGLPAASGDWLSQVLDLAHFASPPFPGAPLPPLEEPPPLDQWLRGREQLTVAQDGSAKFRTIGEALSQLKAGQAVVVLDAGPYTEDLGSGPLPENTGLVSRAGTVVKIAKWKAQTLPDAAPKEEYPYAGLFLLATAGFRLSGFEFSGSALPSNTEHAQLVNVVSLGDLFVDHCRFVFSAEPSQIIPQHRLSGLGMTLLGRGRVSDCSFTCSLECLQAMGGIAIERNYVSGSVTCTSPARHLILRQNVVNLGLKYELATKPLVAAGPDRLVIVNNLFKELPIAFRSSTPYDDSKPMPREVEIRNNILQSAAYFGIEFHHEPDWKLSNEYWLVGTNCYPREPAEKIGTKFNFARQSSDLVMVPTFLSNDPSSPDYARVPTTSPLATSGAPRGVYPYYRHIGPLPAGPAPPTGDWFTRLMRTHK